jgi:radical SAM superfamily enzyme YgiQ (UPF0313 family)
MIEFSIYDQFPLISGYMQGYATRDAAVAETFEFVNHNQEVERASSYEETLHRIRAYEASILCFSCYVWNMGLVKRLVHSLRQDKNVERIILGGHQVSHNIHRYVDRTDEKTFVINGPGEIPFRAFMRVLAEGGDPSAIKGLSFYRDGELHMGGEAEMVKDLDEIPSPFLSGLFDSMSHPITIIETNRGCPYKCSFCTWGGDTTTVKKFSTDRIKEELQWIAKKSVLFVYIGDANWGMLPRDVELSEYIARMKKERGFPWMVSYAAAKNKPKGSVACIEKFFEGGVITAQALGIQSMNTDTLSLIDRGNIKNSAFIEMFDQLKTRNIDSYCELMWPLPGETLATLKSGFEQLIDLGARTTILYPVLLINNAKMSDQATTFGLETTTCEDWKSELKRVRKTKFADRNAVDDGFWFYYAYFLLANCDLDKALLRLLKRLTGKSYGEVVGQFASYLQKNATTSEYARLVTSLFEEDSHGSLMTIGRVAVHLTHDGRRAAQRDVIRFITTTQLPEDVDRALVLAAVWAFSLPRLFAQTKEDVEAVLATLDEWGQSQGRPFSDLAAVEPGKREIVLTLHGGQEAWLDVARYFAGTVPDPLRSLTIRHVSGHMNYNTDTNRNFVYAHGMIQRLGHIAARFETA